MIRVVVTGASGRMGREVCRGILRDPELELAGAVDVQNVGTDVGDLIGEKPIGIRITDDLPTCLQDSRASVMVDFTNSQACMANARLAAGQGLNLVIGTTGITSQQIDELHGLAEQQGVGILLVPNFALGAVLMMHFAQIAARYFPLVEIIEMHHEQKLDAPSGTALKTAELILEARAEAPPPRVQEYERLAGCRGGDYQGIRIHSVRLPGFVAHQRVIFGGNGQTLSIQHDTVSRESFIPGVLLAVKEVGRIRGLMYGLENLLRL
ncbi:MAG: 4-hydroxy-tetrahydrodipicolinate reductase [Moorellales bacterium]